MMNTSSATLNLDHLTVAYARNYLRIAPGNCMILLRIAIKKSSTRFTSQFTVAMLVLQYVAAIKIAIQSWFRFKIKFHYCLFFTFYVVVVGGSNISLQRISNSLLSPASSFAIDSINILVQWTFIIVFCQYRGCSTCAVNSKGPPIVLMCSSQAAQGVWATAASAQPSRWL